MQIPAFRNLNESECHQLLEIAGERSFAPGQRVIEQGKTSQFLWILLDGKCEVARDSQHDGALLLAELEPYSVFGEMSFFSPAPHSANVVARTPIKLLCISRADYDDLVRDGIMAAYKLAYNVAESLAGRLRRMDELAAEMAADGEAHPTPDGSMPEWHKFREKVFKGWEL
jgi:CRP-like cAMP-binding protein